MSVPQMGGCCMCGRPPVSALCGRLIRYGLPLNDDTTLDAQGFTREWNPNTSMLGPAEWSLVINSAEVGAGHHYTTGSGSSLKYWLSWKLRPYRIRLGMDTTQPNGLFYRPYGNFHLEQYNLSSWGLTPVNLRQLGPPAAGHSGKVIATNPEFFSLLVLNRSIFEAFSPQDANTLSHSMFVRYVRYVINGEDVTGPLPISHPINTVISHSGFNVIGTLLAGSVSHPAGLNITDATIDIDLWHEVAVGGESIGNMSGAGASPWNGGGSAEGWHVVSMMARTYYAWTGEVYPRIGRVMFSGGNANKKIPRSKVFRLEFDRQGPGGVPALQMQQQPGWTGDVSYTGGVKLVHGATGDFAEVVYGQEVPSIVIYRSAAIGVIGGTSYLGQARYYPVDTDHYDALPVQPSSLYTQPIRGMWNPEQPNVFRLAGRQQGSPNNLTMEPIGLNGSSRDKDSVYYDDFPYEITLSLVSPRRLETIEYKETTDWVCPPGVLSVQVRCWGGGGGGGASDDSSGSAAGGGGGGAFAQREVTVTPGTTYHINVGLGGQGGYDGNINGGAGGDSWFSTVTTVRAKGGSGGQGATLDDDEAGGAGGSALSSVGTLKRRGGNGASGLSGSWGGGGGASASDTADGASSTTGTGALGVNGGGNGGDGTIPTGGGVPGGGGGGAKGDGSSSMIRPGAAGGDGLVILQFLGAP